MVPSHERAGENRTSTWWHEDSWKRESFTPDSILVSQAAVFLANG
jgi:hypothetical protein